jgi:ADP-ribose pyrophosphatase
MKLKEEQVSAEYVFKGKVINVRCDKAKIYDGRIVDREVVEHPGGVGIALEDEEGRFFMVTQYRYAQEKVMTEYPAGKREAGEEPLLTAQRDIIEETGYEGVDFFYLGQMAPTPAYDSEIIHLFYARQGEFKGQHLDADEDLNVSKMTLDEITARIMSGEITDAKTIGMTFLVRAYKEGKYD